MKLNKLLLVLSLTAIVSSAHAQRAVLQNLDDGLGEPVKIVSLDQWKRERALSPHKESVSAPLAFPLIGSDHVIMTSLPASASPNRTLSYTYALAGVSGVSVPTDRSVNPAAWYRIPTNGLQWFDPVSTSFNCWMGSPIITNPAASNESNHRMVLHETGTFPVSAYVLTVTSTLTNVPALSLNIATNSSDGSEIAWNNPNFIGFDVGANGIKESFYDTSSGTVVVGGDDHVLTNGLPSQSTYQSFWRFGATFSIQVASTSEFTGIKNQFAAGTASVTATLKRNGTTVDSFRATAETSVVSIERYGTNAFRVLINGGQINYPYGLQASVDFTNWVPVYTNQTFFTGTPVLVTNDRSFRYFRTVNQTK